MSAPQIFVGIDVAKAQLDIALRPTEERWTVPNDEASIATLVTQLQAVCPVLIVLEATGGFQRAVVAALAAAALPVVVVNPRQARDFAKATGQLAKTDVLDARALAHFAEAVRPTPRPLPDAQTDDLRALLARRRQLVAMRTTESNRLGEDFVSLAAKGTVPVSPEPLIHFADLTFPTPSGRIEIASARAEADGHPRVPLPLADPRPAGGRLRLLSPASPWLMNDSFANARKIAARLGPATVALHPTDAAERGLADGDEALVSNETGRLALRVALSEVFPRGVVLSHKGRWPKQEASAANVNVLNPGQKSDMGESTCVHGVEVTVTPLTTGERVLPPGVLA
jgi:Transposase/Molydopterin dinucleotide binding domain